MPGSGVSFYSEAGSTGLTRFGGLIYEEWLRALQGTKGVRVYREMRDNDAIVGAFLYAVEMLLRQVNWHVEKGGDTPADDEAKKFLEECFDDMSDAWADMLSEILSMLPFGWAYLEVVYKKRNGSTSSIYKDPMQPQPEKSKYSDGRIGWNKWALRAQETLSQWKFNNETNELVGMEQQAPPDYKIRYIPADKALLFRPHITKGNPEGRSILRNAYRSHYMKKNIEEIEAIGIERDLAGLPVMWVPPEILSGTDATATKAYAAYKKIITNIRRDEQEGVMMPLVYDGNNNKMYDLTLLSTGSRRQFDTNAIVARYDQRIAVTVMADFLLLGSGEVGKFALSSDKTNLFSTALGTILDSIQGVINTNAVATLFELNDFGELTDLPKYVHEDIESPDLAALGAYVQQLSGAQMQLFPDDDLENYLRNAANLPKKPEVMEPSVDVGIETPGGFGSVPGGFSPIAGAPAVPGGFGSTPVPSPAVVPGGFGTRPAAAQPMAKIEKSYQDDRARFLTAVETLQQAVDKELKNGKQ